MKVTKHTWTNIVAALLFLACVAVVSFVPTPFVTWGPGNTYDLLGDTETAPMVGVTNVETFATNGQVRMTTVGVTPADAQVNLIQVLVGYLSPSEDVFPREVVYPPQLDTQTLAAQEAAQMSTSQSASIVAALRAARMPVTERPMIVSVAASGPSAEHLEAGDLVTTVDGHPVTSTQQVEDAIKDHSVGDPVLVGYLRGSVSGTETITTRASATQPDVPAIGVTMGPGYVYTPRITFGIDPEIGGPSAGLMFALAIYDKITTGDLTAGRVVAGTGAIDERGAVGVVGGVKEKAAAAVRDQADVFVMPRANCADLTAPAGVRVVAVATLAEAVEALERLKDPAAPQTSGCA